MLARLLLLAAALVFAPGGAASAASLAVEGQRFTVTADDGRRLGSAELVGAVLDVALPSGPATIRIDAVTPAEERPSILLHAFSVRDPRTGAWSPLCEADGHGRRAGFPVAGRWDGGRFLADRAAWFLTCTAGAQAKCLLWGYDPWSRGPDGRSLAPLYEACQHLVRADYAGDGAARTRAGAVVDVYDDAGVRTAATRGEPAFAFEAGWSSDGAVCVARTRRADILALSALVSDAPHLAGPCDEAEARRRGAVLYNRSLLRP